MFACRVRLQTSNVFVRECLILGVQASPKLPVKSNDAERGKAVTPPCRDAGQANREAGLWRNGIVKLEEAKAVL